MINLPR